MIRSFFANRFVRFFLASLLVLIVLTLTGAAGTAAYYLYYDPNPVSMRPDLITPPPEGIPPAPPGFATERGAYIALALAYFGPFEFLTGPIELIDPSPDRFPDVQRTNDVEYGRVGDRPLLLDRFTPKTPRENAPALICVHGGSWSGGHKEDLAYYGYWFAERGYVTVSIEYRRSREAPFPAALEDTKCAIRWLRANAAEYGVDPDRIAILGGSAGGHLALMAAYTDAAAGFEGTGGHPDVSSSVAAVIDFYGPTDLTHELTRDHPAVTKFLNANYADSPGIFAAASPLHALDADDPPTLVIHGTVDEIVSVEHSDWLVERLKDLGIPYGYDRIHGWPHGLDAVAAVNAHSSALALHFLEEHMGPRQEAPDKTSEP